MLMIPGAIIALIGLHLYLVIRLGVTSPPWSKEAAGTGPLVPADAERPPLPASRGSRPRRGKRGLMASDRVVERRRIFKQYKDDVEGARQAVLPVRDVPRHDHVARRRVRDRRARDRLEVHDAGRPHVDRAGWLGKLYDAPADPGTINFVPRPDWYFYFLFYLLRVFKWPETVILGTIGIPTICLVLLLAVPFIDMRTERRLSRRPVADRRRGARHPLDGDPHLQGRDREGGARHGAARRRAALGGAAGLREQPEGGRRARRSSRSPAASTATRTSAWAAASPERPNLSAEGAKNKGIAFQIAHLKCPACVNPGSPMPSFAGLGLARLTLLANFLEASKGPK